METRPDENAGGDLLCRRVGRRRRSLWVRIGMGGVLILTIVLMLGVLYVVWFVTGSRTRYYHRPYDLLPADHGGPPWLWQARATYLENLRRVADLGIWRSRLAAKEGHLRPALEDCLILMRAGVPWQGRATLVEQLTGSALGSMAHEQVLQMVATASLSEADLSWLQEQITEVYAGGFLRINLEGDKLCLLDTVQHVFTEGGRGGGHVIPRELARLFEMIGAEVSYWGPPPKGKLPYLLLSMAHVQRDEFLAKANELYDRADQLTQMTPYQSRQAGIRNLERTIEALDKRKYALIWWICPAAERVSNLAFGHEALHEGTLLVLALRRWWLEKGSYPAELKMLVEEQYLRELPLDPFRDGPPVYRRTQEGFLLYSLGPNFTDEGGRPALDRTGRPRLFAGGGDLVFWPPVYVP